MLKKNIPFCTSGGKECLMEGQKREWLCWCLGTSQITGHPLLFHTCNCNFVRFMKERRKGQHLGSKNKELLRERRYKFNSRKLTKLCHFLLGAHVND